MKTMTVSELITELSKHGESKRVYLVSRGEAYPILEVKGWSDDEVDIGGGWVPIKENEDLE